MPEADLTHDLDRLCTMQALCALHTEEHTSQLTFLLQAHGGFAALFLLLLSPLPRPYQPLGHISSQTNRHAYGHLVWKTSPNQRRTRCEVGQVDMSRTLAQDGKSIGRDAQSRAEKGRVFTGRSTRNQTESSSTSSPDQASSFH